ncbi:conjugal transfer protein [Pseudomonas viridiflava]|uniref:conjugal transfer protein n=1 Tax=Pseudomonas viridiflava TaxID=33069 RepID=UPI0013CEC277|nr:conjugal transfer protein [Pseudomonas viridiflava]
MLGKKLRNLVLIVLCAAPAAAMAAGWDAELQKWGTAIRLALYALGGTLGLACLMWSGIQWQIARATGDRSHTFMDYLQQVGVLVVVGSTMVLGAAAWQVFGTGVPA